MNRNVPLARAPFARKPGRPQLRSVSTGRITPSRAEKFSAAGSRVPEAKKSAATRRPTGFSPAVKLLVCTRAGHGDPDLAMCEACGIWVGRHQGDHQHIVARGMGGCKLAVINSAANCALLCRRCHDLCEARDPHMEAAGFWAKQGGNPQLLPMMLASEGGSGVLVWRSMDGEYLLEAPKELAA